MISFVIVAAIATGEVLVRVTTPVRTMYPRYKFIPEYGFGLYPNRTIVHAQPGNFEFHYTVNEYGYRGDPLPVADSYSTRNIVVLGDSYSFGQGVEDDEPYAAVMEGLLGDEYAVINLGSPGWGLTQEIRRYFELGTLYRPEILVLQYCWNDPEDNLNHRVTVVDDGEFQFTTSVNTTNRAKKYLSGSLIQKSQLYNFYRGRIYEWFQNRHVRQTSAKLTPADTANATFSPLPREELYFDLLNLFVEKLESDGVLLIVISVEDRRLKSHYIAERMRSLHKAGRIHYVDLNVVFADAGRGDQFYSAEGHWGPRAHRLIAESLTATIRRMAPE